MPLIITRGIVAILEPTALIGVAQTLRTCSATLRLRRRTERILFPVVDTSVKKERASEVVEAVSATAALTGGLAEAGIAIK